MCILLFAWILKNAYWCTYYVLCWKSDFFFFSDFPVLFVRAIHVVPWILGLFFFPIRCSELLNHWSVCLSLYWSYIALFARLCRMPQYLRRQFLPTSFHSSLHASCGIWRSERLRKPNQLFLKIPSHYGEKNEHIASTVRTGVSVVYFLIRVFYLV